MERIIEELKNYIAKETGLMPVLAPQAAGGNTAAITLFFSGIQLAGERARGGVSEEISFTAELSSSGTHTHWLNEVIVCSLKLDELAHKGPLPLVVREGDAEYRTVMTWDRVQAGQFVYDEEDKNMPVAYKEIYSVFVRYPADIIGGSNAGNR